MPSVAAPAYRSLWRDPEHGLVAGGKGLVKVLGRGEIGKALTVRAHKFSGKAAEKIAAAGGATEQL